MDNQELQNDYKKLYEAEREKTEVLLSKIEESEKEIEELRFKLDRIKNSFAWKLSIPLPYTLRFYPGLNAQGAQQASGAQKHEAPRDSQLPHTGGSEKAAGDSF